MAAAGDSILRARPKPPAGRALAGTAISGRPAALPPGSLLLLGSLTRNKLPRHGGAHVVATAAAFPYEPGAHAHLPKDSRRSTMKSRNAFTLIELLVVIAIIAILAAILFPVFAQ